MNPSKLKHRIDVYGNVKKINKLNETSYSFDKIKTIYAEILPQTGNMQRQQVETILTNVTHKIIVRYQTGKDITKDMQIKYRGSLFEIQYILNPYYKNELLEIFVVEVME